VKSARMEEGGGRRAERERAQRPLGEKNSNTVFPRVNTLSPRGNTVSPRGNTVSHGGLESNILLPF
jgi:hypothetical protein